MVFGIAQELAARVRVAARRVQPLRGRAGASAPERQVAAVRWRTGVILTKFVNFLNY